VAVVIGPRSDVRAGKEQGRASCGTKEFAAGLLDAYCNGSLG
jgi:hypothetical protein